jgi:GNAT superfamily N-acetyltransferase
MDVLRLAVPGDTDALFDVRAATRDNAIPRERLAALGITPATLAAAMAQGDYRAWVIEADHRVVAFCGADRSQGEIAVLAVRSGFEGRGFGAQLLDAAVAWLHATGCERVWLFAGADPALRSHGFYRARGWAPSGRRDANGDEELVLDVRGGADRG